MKNIDLLDLAWNKFENSIFPQSKKPLVKGRISYKFNIRAKSSVSNRLLTMACMR